MADKKQTETVEKKEYILKGNIGTKKDGTPKYLAGTTRKLTIEEARTLKNQKLI